MTYLTNGGRSESQERPVTYLADGGRVESKERSLGKSSVAMTGGRTEEAAVLP